MGSSENGSTFMWVKLKSGRVPANYVNKGLNTRQFVASNDLYGSFCRARITVQSDDKDIQDLLKNNSVAYFAVGDSFTCGSWISDADLRKISDTVGNRELCKQGYGTWVDGKCDGSKLSTKEKIAYAWGTVAPALAGTGIGLGLTESGLVGGLLNKSNQVNSNSATQSQKKALCASLADNLISRAYNDDAAAAAADFKSLGDLCEDVVMKGLESQCKLSDTEKTTVDGVKARARAVKSACDNASKNTVDEKGTKAARIAIPIVTGVVAGGLGAGITASVIKQNRENIKNTAAQQWMDEVGEHIQCYIGTEELGTYGDVVSIELD